MNDWEITASPAYGRDYDNASEAFDAWLADKDFCIHTPGHPSLINKADAEEYGVPNDTVRIRYNKLSEIFFVKFDRTNKVWTRSQSTDEDERKGRE